MRRRAFTVLAIAALVCGALAPTAAVAAGSTAARFQRLNVGKIDPQLLPALIDPNRVMDVMVQLADEPVASHVGDAKDNGTTVTASQKNSWRTQIQATQTPVVNAVRKFGGVVISQMQDAYNGIHVHVKAADLTTLASMSGVDRHPPDPGLQAGPDRERAVRRRAAGLDLERLHRCRRQDRDHRHRHRLLPRRLRRLGQSGRLHVRPGQRHDAARPRMPNGKRGVPERQDSGGLRLRRR